MSNYCTKGWPARKLGRLKKCLDREYRFDCGVMPLREWLNSQDLTHKEKYVRKRARKKRQGQYKELAQPKTEYSVWTGDTGIDIPKLVWDALTTKEA